MKEFFTIKSTTLYIYLTPVKNHHCFYLIENSPIIIKYDKLYVKKSHKKYIYPGLKSAVVAGTRNLMLFYLGVFRPNMLYTIKVFFILMNICFDGKT